MPLPSAYLARCVNTPNEEALRLTYQYLMTAEGSAALAELQLPEAERCITLTLRRALHNPNANPDPNPNPNPNPNL